MKYNEIINETYLAPLYHAYRNIDYALLSLKTNKMAATTTQRFWNDGKRRIQQSPNDEEYENSYWYKGISLTRDLKFAENWGDIIFILDQDKLKQTYKLIPLNWQYSIKDSKSRKAEKEEFLIIKSTKDDYLFPQEYEGQERRYRFDMKRFRSIEGYLNNLSKYLIGIYI